MKGRKPFLKKENNVNYNYYLRLFILSILIIGCKKNENDILFSKKIDGYKLMKADSLIYYNTAESFIGSPTQVEYWNNYILVSDRAQTTVFILDSKMNLIKKIGNKGRGPNEFIREPRIILEDSTFLLHSMNMLERYSSKLLFVEKIKLPEKLIFQKGLNEDIMFGDKFVFSAHEPDWFNFNGYKPIYVLTERFKNYLNLGKWDEIYTDPAYSAYTSEQSIVLFAKNHKSSFFAKQQASNIIQHYNSSFNIINQFCYIPSFFRKLPKVTIKEYQKNYETVISYVKNITYCYKLCYDEKKQHLIVGYFHLPKDYKQGVQFTGGEYYINIFDKDYNCIYDGSSPGLLEFVKGGKIYFRSDFTEEHFTLIECELKKL
jgi:hypothetical protein